VVTLSDTVILLWTPPAIEPPPPTPDLPELVVRGHCFEQANGTRWTAIQCSDFNVLNRWQHGEDVTPILAQRRDCGFTLLRVWTAYDIYGIGQFLDLDYARLPAFIDVCEAHGLYVELCAYTGVNDPLHWEHLCAAALACRPRPILELVNELSENTDEPDAHGRVFNLWEYARPHGLLVSRGSNGSEKPPVGSDWVPVGTDQWDYFSMQEPLPAFWDYVTMHYNDAYEWIRKTGHNSMAREEFNVDIPCIANENTRFCDKAHASGLMNPATPIAIWAHDAAAGAALLCAGSCFHSVAGKTSELWHGEELDAACAWAAGARTVDLHYQDGVYRHPIELETPDLLRVYQRALPDGRYAQVNIRR
jgi:hypothetical protein